MGKEKLKMEITIQNTKSLYKELLSVPEEKRADFYESEFLKPYHELKEKYMPSNPEWMGALPLSGHDREMEEALNKLQAIDAWKMAKESLQNDSKRFKSEGIPMTEKVFIGIFLGD